MSYTFLEDEIDDLTLLELFSSDPELGKRVEDTLEELNPLEDDSSRISRGGNRRAERPVNEDDEDPNIEELEE